MPDKANNSTDEHSSISNNSFTQCAPSQNPDNTNRNDNQAGSCHLPLINCMSAMRMQSSLPSMPNPSHNHNTFSTSVTWANGTDIHPNQVMPQQHSHDAQYKQHPFPGAPFAVDTNEKNAGGSNNVATNSLPQTAMSSATTKPEGSTVMHHFHPTYSCMSPAIGHHNPMINFCSPFSSSVAQSASYCQRAADLFRHIKPRRGKWTMEEENYANYLINEFENGTAPDCENGCTLRAYLSKKLHCAPMRISKKFAGKSIGKHVFISRTASSSHPASLEKYRKLSHLEQSFCASVINETNGIMGNYAMLPYAKNPMQTQNSNTASSSAASQQACPQEVNNIQNKSAILNTRANSHASSQSGHNVSFSPEVTSASTNRNFSQPKSQERKINGVPCMNDFLAAFENTTDGSEDSATAGDRAHVRIESSPTIGPLTSKSCDDFHKYLGVGIPSPNVKPLQGPASKALQLQMKQLVNESLLISDEGVVGKSGDIGMPPFGNASLIDDDEAAKNTGSMKIDACKIPVHVSADSYALFAQESALAVSQHSAYCRADIFETPTMMFHDAVPSFKVGGRRASYDEIAPSATIIPTDDSSTVPRSKTKHHHLHARSKESSTSTVEHNNTNASLQIEPVKRHETETMEHHRATKRLRTSGMDSVNQKNLVSSLTHIPSHLSASSKSALVSGSERSVSDPGTETESAQESRGSGTDSNTGSGSDNTSDNDNENDVSDSASVEGQSSSDAQGTATQSSSLSNGPPSKNDHGGENILEQQLKLTVATAASDRDATAVSK